jgi:hypothetical protein
MMQIDLQSQDTATAPRRDMHVMLVTATVAYFGRPPSPFHELSLLMALGRTGAKWAVPGSLPGLQLVSSDEPL